MLKRRSPAPASQLDTPTRRVRLSTWDEDDLHPTALYNAELASDNKDSEETQQENDLTPRPTKQRLFSTPSKKGVITPSKTQADRSAKRKAVQTLIESNEAEDENADIALSILDDEVITPSRRSRGRPKGARNRRSPTPEGDVPPEERYFFQTRTGPQNFSTNSFVDLGLLEHADYLDEVKEAIDPHELEMAYLLKLHARAFPQWFFELREGFSVCLYGWGSKRALINKFADWLVQKSSFRIVVVNGYTPRINLKTVLNTIASAISTDSEAEVKLAGGINDALDTVLALLSDSDGQVFLLVNSLDGPSLRRPSYQSLLSRLSASPNVHFLATTDTPTFQLLFSSSTRLQYNFTYHDATTFAPYDLETSPVDDVNELLGRKGRRAGGKDGIMFVLRSLPENARNLYRVLLTELLMLIMNGDEDGDEDDGPGTPGKKQGEIIGVEYRTLYQKATEEFICSSDMNFRFLLKEFNDHQMLTLTRDAGGTEIIGVPLSLDEIEAVLEEIVT